MTPKRIIVTLPLEGRGALSVEPALADPPDPRDPVAVVETLVQDGADEFLLTTDPSAPPPPDILARTVERLTAVALPFAVRAEPTDAAAASRLLEAGAARIVIGASGLADPDFIARLVDRFGSASVAVSLTAAREDGTWRVQEDGGIATEWQAVTWARVAEAQGAGELWVRAPAPDGGPYDLGLLESVTSALHIPVVAAGEARSVQDLFDALMIGDSDGVAAAGLFLSGSMTVEMARADLAEHGLPVRRD